MIRPLLALALLAPGAAAVGALEDAPRLEATQARLLVRAEGALVVTADGPARAGGAAPGGAPASLAPVPVRVEPTGATWHGLDDVVEIVVERDDATRALMVEVVDERGAGLSFEWPAAAREVPAAGALAPLLLAAALVRTRSLQGQGRTVAARWIRRSMRACSIVSGRTSGGTATSSTSSSRRS